MSKRWHGVTGARDWEPGTMTDRLGCHTTTQWIAVSVGVLVGKAIPKWTGNS